MKASTLLAILLFAMICFFVALLDVLTTGANSFNEMDLLGKLMVLEVIVSLGIFVIYYLILPLWIFIKKMF